VNKLIAALDDMLADYSGKLEVERLKRARGMLAGLISNDCDALIDLITGGNHVRRENLVDMIAQHE
jgi:hypothetical protein